MLNSQIYYYASTKLAVIAFGNLFKKVVLRRVDADGNVVQQINTPIRYAPKEAFLTVLRAESAPEGKQIQHTLPRMSFEITSFQYDTARKTNMLGRVIRGIRGVGDYAKFTFNVVPYTLGFQLNIGARNSDDGYQLLEQILPNFQPYFNVTVIEQADLGIVRDIPITLTGVNTEIAFDATQDDASGKKWLATLDFTMKMNYYGILRRQNIIRRVVVQDYLATSNTFANSEYNFDDPSEEQVNSATRSVTVPNPLDAEPGDDFGYTEYITTNMRVQ